MAININKNILKKVEDSNKSSTFNNFNNKPNNTAYSRALSKQMAYGISDAFIVDKELYDTDLKRNQVIRNKHTTEEELQKQRAKNQSIGEQFFNFLEQAIVGEVILGSFQGLTDIADIAYNAIAEIGAGIAKQERTQDYTNPMSKFFENLREQNRERFAIHEKDPNKAFAVGDFGWWMNGLTTIATTASLLIPTMTLSKGVSLLGSSLKAARLKKAGASASRIAHELNGASRLSKSIAGGLHKTGLSKYPSTLAKEIDMGANIGFNAVTQRTIENWQEGREVYNATYEDALNKYRELNDEDREKFFLNNPEFVGKTDEQIAEYIASGAASKTFWNDYAMLLMDIPQFAGISSMWRGMAKKAITGNLDIVNQNVARRLAKGVSPAVGGKNLTELTELGKTIVSGKADDLIKNNFINRVKSSFKRPLSAFGALELGEGIEEAYQGIMSDKGFEFADLIFDPNTPTKTLQSYLSDPEILEQAVWGVLGGIGFKVVGTGLGNLSRKITDKHNKANMSETDYAKSRLTDEKIRELEILGRTNTIQEFATNMDLLNKNKNPFKKNREGTDYEVLTDEQADSMKSSVVQDFITKLTLDAVDAGNFDLLVDFVSAPEFINYLKDAGIYDSTSLKLNQTMIDKMKEIRERYQTYLYEALEYENNESPWVSNLIARLSTRKSLTLDDIHGQLAEIKEDLDIDSAYLNSAEVDFFTKEAKNILSEYINITKAYRDGNISRFAYDAYLNDFNKEFVILTDASFVHIPATVDFSKIDGVEGKLNALISAYEAIKAENPESYRKNENNRPNKSQLDLLSKRLNLQYLMNKERASIPKTDAEFKEIYDELDRKITETAIKKYNNAKKLITDYLDNAENLDVAIDNIINNENVSKEISDALELLKIGYGKTADLWADIYAEYSIKAMALAEEKANDAKVVVNGKTVDNNVKGNDDVASAFNNAIDGDSSTGGEPKAPPTTPVPPAPTEPPVVEPTGKQTEVLPTKQTSDVKPTGLDVNEAPPPKPKEVKVDDSLPKDNINDVEKYAYDVHNYIFNNIKGDIGIFLADIIEHGDIERESYNKLYNIIRSNLSSKFENLDEETIGKIINAGIVKFLHLKISAIQRKGKDAIKEFTLAQLLSDKNNLASEFSTISILPVEERTNPIVKAFINYYKRINRELKDKNVISLIELFNAIIEDNPKITYYELLTLYKLINPYVAKGIKQEINGKTVAFIFDSYSKNQFNLGFDKFIKNGLNNPEFSDKHSVSGLRMAKVSEQGNDIIAEINAGTIKNPVLTLRSNVEQYGNTLSIIYTAPNGEKTELGKISKVSKIADENGNVTIKNVHSNGLLFVFEEDVNGNRISNFDNLFYELHIANENKDSDKENPYLAVLEMIKRVNEGSNLTEEDFNTLMSLDEIKRLYEAGKVEERIDETNSFERTKGGIVLSFKKFNADGKPDIGTKEEQATKIINAILPVFLNEAGYLDLNNLYMHYLNYSNYVYDANVSVYEAQEKLTNGFNVEIELISEEDNRLNVVDELVPVNEIINAERYAEYPIFKVNELGEGVCEDGQVVSSDVRHNGSIGIILSRGIRPLTTLATANRVGESKSELNNLLRNELRTIIKGFLNKEQGYSFDEVAKKLNLLLAGNVKHKLFSNINIVVNQGIIALRPYVNLAEEDASYERQPILAAFNKYGSAEDRAKASQKGVQVQERPYVLTRGVNEQQGYTFRQYADEKADVIVDNILQYVKFNLSDIAFINSEITKENNPYFYKEDGKIVIEIGGEKRVYENYAQLLYTENAISTQVALNKEGNIFNGVQNRAKGIPLAIKSTKVDNTINRIEKYTLQDIFKLARNRNHRNMATDELLRAAGLSSGLINNLLSFNGYNLVDTEIFLMSKKQRKEHPNAYFIYNATEDKTYINTTKFLNIESDSDLQAEVIRALVHEKFHKLFNQAEVNPLRRTEVINELIDTYILFNDRLNEEKDTNPLARAILEKFNKFIDKYQIRNKQVYIDGKPANAVDTQRFVEEWLVESLTQPALLQFNNEKEVVDADISHLNKSNKSIFQRIIDAVIKLFNIVAQSLKKNNVKIKNNTILAKQYLLLSTDINNLSKEPQTIQNQAPEKDGGEVRVKEESVVPPVGESPNEPAPFKPAEPVGEKKAANNRRLDRRRERKSFTKHNELSDDLESAYPLITYDVESKEDAIIQGTTANNEVNPSGVISISNINDYMNLFDEAEKLKIATLIEQNGLNYLCQ